MKASIFLPAKASQWFMLFLSLAAAMVVTFFVLSFACSVDQTTEIFRTADHFRLHDSLIYQTCYDFYLSNEDKSLERDKIRATKGVQDVNIVSSYSLLLPIQKEAVDSDKTEVTCINYSDTLLRDVRYRLISGHYPTPDQMNAILLPSSLADQYTIGEKITGTVSSVDDSHEGLSVSLEVAGFLAEQPLLNFYSSGPGLALTDLLYRDFDTTSFWSGIGIVYGIYDSKKNMVTPEYSDLFMIRAEKSTSTQELKDSLAKIVETPAQLFTGDDLIEDYIHANRSEITETVILGITALVLSFSIITASTLLEMIYRRKEMLTLYLCGASWRKCIRIILTGQILPIWGGFLLGVILFAKSGKWHLFYLLVPRFEWSYVLIAFGVEVFFLILAILPALLARSFRSPQQLFRKD